MAKEILLYNHFYSFTAESFIEQLEEAKGEDVEISMDSNGGDPQAAFGMIRKLQKHEGNTSLEIHGRAYSMGAFFACYTNNASSLDVSDFLFHRAALPYWVENDPEAMKAELPRLTAINNHLRTALEAKVDVDKFERITNTTLDQLFSLDGRIDVKLNAKQAKQVKLIDKIITITPEISAKREANALVTNNQLAAHFTGKEITKPVIATELIEDNTTSNKDMDLNKLKTEHPSVYAQAVTEGHTQGVKQENERVSAFLVFADVDLKAVKAGIESAEALSTVQMAELTRKSVSAEILKGLEGEAPEAVVTDASAEEAKTEEEIAKDAKIAEFEANVKNNLK